MRWQRYLRNLYRNVKKGGSYQSAEKLHETVKREGRFDISLGQVKKWLEGEDTYTLNKEVRRFKTNHIGITDLDVVWEADLADLGKYASWNGGYRFLLGCIDSFSRKLWVRPLKTKGGVEIVQALKEIFAQDGRRPRTIRTDRGSEFTNRTVSRFLSGEKIGQSFTSNLSQAAYIERCWKSLKKRTVKYMQDKRTWNYLPILQDLVRGYNDTHHSALGMRPNDVTSQNRMEVEYIQLERRNKRARRRGRRAVSKQPTTAAEPSGGILPERPLKEPKFIFDADDYVRISLRPEKLSSEYKQRWSTEVFVVRSRRMRNGIPVYKVKDLDGEGLIGSFYAQELQKVEEPRKDAYYDVDRVLDERVVEKGGKKSKEYFVSFTGYHPKFNQWLPESSVKDLSGKNKSSKKKKGSTS